MGIANTNGYLEISRYRFTFHLLVDTVMTRAKIAVIMAMVNCWTISLFTLDTVFWEMSRYYICGIAFGLPFLLAFVLDFGYRETVRVEGDMITVIRKRSLFSLRHRYHRNRINDVWVTEMRIGSRLKVRLREEYNGPLSLFGNMFRVRTLVQGLDREQANLILENLTSSGKGSLRAISKVPL